MRFHAMIRYVTTGMVVEKKRNCVQSSLTTVMSPIQKQPTENISLQGESGFTLPNDSRSGYEPPTIIGIVLGILALIIFISIVVALSYRRGKHLDFASCLQEKNTKNDTMDNNKAEIEDFLQKQEKL